MILLRSKKRRTFAMATASPKTAVAPPTPQRQVVKIHVKFTINTPDGLRRVGFDLEKDTQDDGTVNWTITFQLFERAKKTDQFGDAIVDLLVQVDTKLNSKAQAMADNGMTPTQAAFASGPAADTAKDPSVPDPKKQTTIQTTLKR
jgi:hypothetical protein